MKNLVVALSFGLFLLTSSSNASAQHREPHLVFDAPIDLSIAVGAGMVGVAMEYGISSEERGLWGAGPVDKGLRKVFRARRKNAREVANLGGDLGFYGMIAYGLLIDPLTLWDGENSWKLAVINGQALAVTGALVRPFQKLGNRSRPMEEECVKQDGDYSSRCTETSESLLSGHVATAFAIAASSCYLNKKLDSRGAVVKCAVGYSTASMTAWMRLMGDNHWFSDVALGTGVGLAAGLIIGGAHWDNGRVNERSMVIVPFASTQTVGLVAAGTL